MSKPNKFEEETSFDAYGSCDRILLTKFLSSKSIRRIFILFMHLRRGCMLDYSRRHLRDLTSWLVSQPILACDLLALGTEHDDGCDLRGIVNCKVFFSNLSLRLTCLPVYRVHFKRHRTTNSNWLACCICTLSIRPTAYLDAVTQAIFLLRLFTQYPNRLPQVVKIEKEKEKRRPSILIDLRIDGDDIQPPLERERHISSKLFCVWCSLLGVW